MGVLVFVEMDEGKVKKSSLEAVSYGSAMGEETTAIVFGKPDAEDISYLGKAGASNVLQIEDDNFSQPGIMTYSSALAEAFEKVGASTLVMARSSIADPVAARTSIKLKAGLVSNVSALPETSNGFTVQRSIYTGKAFANTEVKAEKKILTLKKNAVAIKEDGSDPSVESFSPTLHESDQKVKITSKEKAEGDVLLPEADIVVSGGRGLKGPENWGMVEELAKVLGAATGCSKPVSDMDWRPHHEHVGQTGIKVAPSLYIAIGISGAIQHLAGVNSSKYILVINKDPEAPFFKAADYGVVGDAFEVVPKLTEAIKAKIG